MSARLCSGRKTMHKGTTNFRQQHLRESLQRATNHPCDNTGDTTTDASSTRQATTNNDDTNGDDNNNTTTERGHFSKRLQTTNDNQRTLQQTFYSFRHGNTLIDCHVGSINPHSPLTNVESQKPKVEEVLFFVIRQCTRLLAKYRQTSVLAEPHNPYTERHLHKLINWGKTTNLGVLWRTSSRH